MAMFFRTPLLLFLVFAVAACGNSEDSEINPPSAPPDQTQTPPRSTPADRPPEPEHQTQATPISEPDERDQVADARIAREALRQQRRQALSGWDGEAIARRLQLDDEQQDRLRAARDSLNRERVAARNVLRMQRDLQRQAEASGDSESLAVIETTRAEARSRLDAAERAWQDSLRDILSPEQLQRLSETD
jgi:hypothetical protein